MLPTVEYALLALAAQGGGRTHLHLERGYKLHVTHHSFVRVLLPLRDLDIRIASAEMELFEEGGVIGEEPRPKRLGRAWQRKILFHECFCVGHMTADESNKI